MSGFREECSLASFFLLNLGKPAPPYILIGFRGVGVFVALEPEWDELTGAC